MRCWAIGTWANQLRNAIASAPPPTTHHHVTAHLTSHGQLSAEVTLKRGGTDDERLTQLENDYNNLLNQLAHQESRLRNEINEAIADALDKFEKLSDAVRLRDIYPVLVGIAVSIAGYLCQLFGA
jgi:hypothetical protein